MKFRATPFLAAAALLALPSVAQAQLTFVGQADNTGGGLGNVATVLTLQNPGGSTVESGCVTPLGTTGCGFADVGVQTGASQTTVRAVSAFPGLTANNFRIFVNGSEPDNAITLNNLVVSLYAPNSSTPLFSSTGFTSMELTNVLSGTGNFGYMFALTGSQLTSFQTALTANPGEFIGVGASFSGAAGGLETISIGTVSGAVSVIPEPSTYLLMASGLAGLFMVHRRRRA
jgi:hypothetical protein